MSNSPQSNMSFFDEECAVLRFATAYFRPSLVETMLRLKGHTLGEWHIDSLLAIGGEGILYRVSSKEKVGVMKMPHLPYDRPVEFGSAEIRNLRQEMDFEAHMLAQFSESLLPALYEVVIAPNPLLKGRDHSVSENEIFIVMEAINGLPIDAWMRQHLEQTGSPDLRPHLLKWLLQLLPFMWNMQQHQPVCYYTDFKPANIWITSQGDVTLLDAGSIFRQGDNRSIPITPGYCSQEVIESQYIAKVSLQALISSIYASTMNKVLWQGITIDVSEMQPYYGSDVALWCKNAFDVNGYANIDEALTSLRSINNTL